MGPQQFVECEIGALRGFLARRRSNDLDGRDELVAALRNGLNVDWVIRVLAERLSHLFHREVHTLLEVHEGITRPECGPDLLTGDEASGLTCEQAEKSERLGLKPDDAAVLEEPFRLHVE